jgi:hypothetical protein
MIDLQENVQPPNDPQTPQWHSSVLCPWDVHHASHPGGAGWGGAGGGDEPSPWTHDAPELVASSTPVQVGVMGR